MHAQTFKILCFGEILWDIFHDEDGVQKVLGGAPSNLCYYFNALGIHATLVSQVGNDDLGFAALKQITSLKIPHLISKSIFPTGKVDIIINNNEPQYIFNTPAAWDSITDSRALDELSTTVDLIAFGSLAHRILSENHVQDKSFDTLKRILNHNPKAKRFLDLNLRHPYYQESRILELLTFADILKINEEEFAYLKNLLGLNHHTMRDALYAMIHLLQLDFIILTLGENGSIVMSENDYSAKSAIKADHLIDTVGAGDAFSAGFLTALYQGSSFIDAHSFANNLSHYICTQKGAFVAIPKSFNVTLSQLNRW